MINPNTRKPSGFSGQALRIWGMVMLAVGVIGQCVIQNVVLNMPNVSNQQLLNAMEDSSVLKFVTAALIMRVVSVCAIPIYAFLLVEGFQRTSSLRKYFLRVLGVALLTELPYNLAMGGKWIDFSGRNPVFGMVIAMVVLYSFRYPIKNKALSVLFKAFVLIMAMVWSATILNIADGVPTLVIVAVLYLLRRKRSWQIFGGCVAMVLCTIISPLYLGAPLTFMIFHFYNEEPGEGNRLTNYLAYPALLLFVGVMTNYIIK